MYNNAIKQSALLGNQPGLIIHATADFLKISKTTKQ